MEVVTSDFSRAIDALFHPHEMAWSLFYESDEGDPFGTLINTRVVTDPKCLPSYWLAHAPAWFDPYGFEENSIGFVPLKGERSRLKVHTSSNNVFNPGRQDVETPLVDGDTFPIFVFEIDYLICDKKVASTADQKRLQAAAIAYALHASGFPATLMVDSGSKSIHAYIRVTDDLEAIRSFRTGDGFSYLKRLAWQVFGDFDELVLQTVGRSGRLIRTPGALRDNGAEQKIIQAGAKQTLQGMIQWFEAQLAPECVQEIRQTLHTTKANSPTLTYWFRKHKFKRDLMEEIHQEGNRGTHWMWVSKTLAMAGASRPYLQQGKINAPFLWHFSSYVYNHLTQGWFFDPQMWNEAERFRWWDQRDIRQHISEARKAENFDPVTAQLTDTMQASLPALEEAPKPADFAPAIAVGQTVGAQVQPEEKKKKKGVDWREIAARYYQEFMPRDNIFHISAAQGGTWRIFDGRKWIKIGGDTMLSSIHHTVMTDGHWKQAHKQEVLSCIANDRHFNESWKENPDAIPFSNGTYYINDNVFKPGFDKNDRLMSTIPFDYNSQAECPLWEHCMERFLPEPSRRLLLQEMFGYTLLTGQPHQAFFLLIGNGANFKGTVLRVIERLWGESVTAVSTALIADKFTLGDVWDKRVAIDGDADQLANSRGLSDGGRIASTIKAWTGGDPVQIQKKNKDPHPVYFNAKLILAANRRPRFVDPTRGVWRRLKVIKFEQVIQEHEKDPNFPLRFNAEMSGILNWAIKGLLRLRHQNGFTTSSVLQADILEYQEDMDSVLQFKNEYMYVDPTAHWQDLRPVFDAYKVYCTDTNSHPCSFTEFKNRLSQYEIHVAQPPATETINGVPFGAGCPISHHYWSMHNMRCIHPNILSATLKPLRPNVNNVIQMPLDRQHNSLS